jgi:hypothetical protein
MYTYISVYTCCIYVIFVSVAFSSGRLALGSGDPLFVVGLGLQFDDGGPRSAALVRGVWAKTMGFSYGF